MIKSFYQWLKFLWQTYGKYGIGYCVVLILVSWFNIHLAKVMLWVGVFGLVIMVMLLALYDTDGFDE